MKRRMFKGILGCFLFLILVGCQKDRLNKKSDTFSSNGSDYSFQLPSGWEIQEDYQDELNEAAVFGAEDTNSRGVMFIRTQKSESMNETQLKEETKKSLSKYYKLEAGKVETFEVNGMPAIHYLMPSVYKKKAVWLDMYFVTTKTQLVNFQFYRSKDNNAEQQQQLIRESVKTLKQLNDDQKTVDSNYPTLENNQKLENEQVSIQLTGNKIEDNQLILRYVVTNKSSKELLPRDEWQKMFTIEELGKKLLMSDQPKTNDSELDYLLACGKQPLLAGESVESAVIYSLQSDGVIKIRVNEGQIRGDIPKVLTIER
ncbi:PsbP-related protein [Enterococcus quebecensis]|uniref:DUF5067 domain-containing protein n=1 Tax=Enterococcus quebecensis TaxID=903983 RepID=A0A1E5GS11_9ENTE|nr:PsbP-related protein [Enterococcus quebecensis]OEG15511.1 hypothetical protein BCR23_08565 [Enterococcus quebecensis]